jgi:predicted porin
MKRITIALAASLVALPAFAADLGGNCCADLEERVAELEATTARKGNRKVSLTVSGQVSKALLWHDIDGLAGDGKLRGIDNSNSGSRLRFEGFAKLSSTMSAGFLYEFGIDETAGKLLGIGSLVDDIQLRHAAAWLSTAAGKLTIGKTSSATDGIVEISVANTTVASLPMSVEPLWTYSGLPGLGFGFVNPTPFDGSRIQLVRYDTPTFGGFTGSAAWGGGESLSGEDVWDVALRYSGEFAGFRLAAGLGHRNEKVGATDTKTFAGSASMMHMPTGLFVNVAAGKQDDNPVFGDMQMWHVQVGAERRISEFGATTAFVEYADHKLKTWDVDSKFWGVGVVQAIDGAAMDVFVSYRKYDIDGFDAQVGMIGTRIRF